MSRIGIPQAEHIRAPAPFKLAMKDGSYLAVEMWEVYGAILNGHPHRQKILWQLMRWVGHYDGRR